MSPQNARSPIRSDKSTGKLRLLLAILTMGSGSGCSILFVDPPPLNHAALPYFDCTSSTWAPNADIVVAGVFAATGIASWSDHSTSRARTNDLVGTLLFTGGFVVSAVNGWQKTANCRQAKSGLAARTAELWRAQWRNGYVPIDSWQSLGPPPMAPAPKPDPAPAPEPAAPPSLESTPP